MPISNPTSLSGYARVTTGTYTGDSTVEREIPHGLGVVPKAVFIWCVSAAGARRSATGHGAAPNNLVHFGEAPYYWDVSSWSAANFEVGNSTEFAQSMNLTTGIYVWVAFA
ncbi:hypothetical protein ES705_46288 [subsurface metagenome]